MSEQGPWQAACNYYECENGIKLSLCPWIKNVGQITYDIVSKLLNLYATMYCKIEPAMLFATFLIEV